MIEDNDKRSIRCRKLGHIVTFGYCRCEAAGKLCSSILNCWWEIFDVEHFLKENDPAALEELLARPPQTKVATILDLIAQARQKASNESEKGS